MKILIVEDERLVARRLERLTREILGGMVEDITVLESLPAGENHLFERPIDLLLLDLNLNSKDGFELLKLASSGGFQTIIVSANTDRAIEAFQYGVVDFVPKPYEADRLRIALDRALAKERSGSPAKFLTIRKFGRVELIPLETVHYFRGAGNYVEIHLSDGRMELHSKSLEALETMLPARFERIHKSYLVDMRAMKGIRILGPGKYEMEIVDGSRIPLSRRHYRLLKERG
jgi:two-component system, LytTR family, response regulator LytT